MDCRTFRRYHLAYLDDTLPGELMSCAERHVVECVPCASHDTTMRRSLLLARNMRHIELSADFSARLAARLDEVRCGRYEVPTDGVPRDDWTPSRAELIRAALAAPFSSPQARTRARKAAIAAGLLALTYAGSQALGWGTATPPIAAVAAAEPLPIVLLPSPAALTSPALVTSASTGIPVWPAALLADQAPAHMVEPQLMLASW